MIAFDVAGVPAPQGSKRGYVANGRAILVESSAKVKPWRADVRQAAEDAHHGPPILGPVVVWLRFRMPRITSLPKTRPAPAHVKKPDIDKLVRSTLDALKSAGVYGDDSQVVELHTNKRYATVTEAPGCLVTVDAAPPEGET